MGFGIGVDEDRVRVVGDEVVGVEDIGGEDVVDENHAVVRHDEVLRSEKIAWLIQAKTRFMLCCYDRALRKIKCGNEEEELSLDVMNHINEYKRETKGGIDINYTCDCCKCLSL